MLLLDKIDQLYRDSCDELALKIIEQSFAQIFISFDFASSDYTMSHKVIDILYCMCRNTDNFHNFYLILTIFEQIINHKNTYYPHAVMNEVQVNAFHKIIMIFLAHKDSSRPEKAVTVINLVSRQLKNGLPDRIMLSVDFLKLLKVNKYNELCWKYKENPTYILTIGNDDTLKSLSSVDFKKYRKSTLRLSSIGKDDKTQSVSFTLDLLYSSYIQAINETSDNVNLEYNNIGCFRKPLARIE